MNNTKIQITTPVRLKELFEKELDDADITMSAAFRMFMKDVVEKKYRFGIIHIPQVDTDTERGIAESLQDLKTGRYTTLKTKKDIESYFDKLDKDS